MRQLALMLEAGVSLLEALETVTAGIPARRGQAQFLAVIAALKRGEPLAASRRALAPGFRNYVYAMAEVGEAAGPACPRCCTGRAPSSSPTRTGCGAISSTP